MARRPPRPAPRRSTAPALAPAVALAVLAGTGLGGCSDERGDLEAFCARARQFAIDNPADVFDRYDPEDPSSAADALRDAADQLEAWGDDAPGEVAGAVDDIAAAAEELADAFERPTEGGAGLRGAVEAVEAASARVVSFTRDRCGVDLEPTSTVTVVLGTTTAPPG